MKFIARRLIPSLLFITLSVSFVTGQQCIEIEGDQTPTVNCGDAPEVCLQNACYGTVNIPDVGFQGFCGPMTIINNPQFFAFTPLDTFAAIEIEVTSCDGSGNSALQAAIVPGCDWTIDSVLVCDPGTPTGGVMVMSYDQFIPNQTYFLLIDGSNGAICQYEILNIVNVFEPDINETLDSAIPNDVVACQGQDSYIATANPSLDNANYYAWSMPWGEEISGSNILDVEVPEDAPTGSFQVCVYAYSGCDTVDMPYPCFNMIIEEVPDIDKDPFVFCPEDLPYSWGALTINGPGTYNLTVDNPEGCPYDSIWQVDVYPDVPVEEIDTVHCGVDVEYEGITYSVDGTYPLQYPGQGLNGCDSAANLNVTLIDLTGTLDFQCMDGEFIISPMDVNYTPSDAVLDYTWFDGGVLMPNENLDQISVISDGNFSVQITVSANGSGCTFDLGPVDIVVSEEVPAAPEFAHGDTLICPNAIATFDIINQDPGVIEYIWAAPGTVNVVNDGSGTAVMDFVNADTESEICVSALNECGEGEQTCFMVELIQLPDVGIQVPGEICQGDTISVVFEGEASNNAEFIWNFGTDATPATETGEGPFDVSWSSAGQKIISVQVAEVGCDTINTEIVVEVEGVSQPVINCSSTIGSITFSWDPVPGADQYIVQLDGGNPFMTMDTFNTTTGLNPGESLMISVTAVTPGLCESVVAVFSCSAQDCPPPTIELSGVDTICLNDYAGPYPLYAIVNGDTTLGMWSGPGITDPSDGVFDPLDPSAGPGQHILTFQYTDASDCTSQDILQVTVLDSIQPDFTIDSVICISDAANVSYAGNASSSANYTWTFDNAQINSGSNEGPYSLSWNTPGVKQVTLSVEENGCTSELFTRTIEVKPELQQPVVDCSPNTTSVTFSWQPDPNADSLGVNLLQGPAGMQNGNQILFDNLMPGDTIMIELVTFGDGTCPDLRDTAMCIAQDCPLVTVEIDSVPPFCLESGLLPFDLDVDVQNGNGSGQWSGTGITDVMAGTFDPSLAGVGTHQVVYTYQDQGCSYNDDIRITINEVPVAVIVDMGLELNCGNGNDLNLDGTASSPSAGLTYSWSTQGGNILSDPQGSSIQAGAAGTYQLKVMTPEDCTDSISVVVTQDADVPVADAGTDRVLNCVQDTVILGGNSTEGPDITYSWSTSNGSITSDGSARVIIADAPGTYELIVTDNANSCTSTDIVEVTEDKTLPMVSASVMDILDCDTESIPIFGDVDANGAPVEISWSTADGNILSGGASEEPVVNRPGTYTMVVENLDNGCKDSVSVVVMADDNIIQSLDVAVQQISCFGDNDGSIEVVAIDGGQAPYAYAWSSGETGSNVTGLSAGTYTVTVSDANGCDTEQSFTIMEPSQLTFSADIQPDANVVFFEGDTASILLTGLPDVGAIDSILWSGASPNGQCLNETSCVFPVFASTSVTVVVIDSNGCIATDQVEIEVNVPRRVFVPNVFTPNGDDQNDFFSVFGSENITSISNFQVYDRWGEVVFQVESISPNLPELGWDGKINGEHALPGVYIYSFLVQYQDGVEEIFKGDLTLLR